MRGHVIGSLGRVPNIRVAVGDHSREETLQVSADARIGVLAEDQRGAGVVEEDHAETPVHRTSDASDITHPDPRDVPGGWGRREEFGSGSSQSC